LRSRGARRRNSESGRPDGPRGAIAFGAKRSRAPLAQRDRWPSKPIAPHRCAGGSLLAKAVVCDGWRVVRSGDCDVANSIVSSATSG
jgi:hypothetical protein